MLPVRESEPMLPEPAVRPIRPFYAPRSRPQRLASPAAKRPASLTFVPVCFWDTTGSIGQTTDQAKLDTYVIIY